MIFDKKRAVSVILSKTDKDGRTTETETAPESGDHNEYTALAEDIIAHVKSGSVQGLASCLKTLCSMSEASEGE